MSKADVLYGLSNIGGYSCFMDSILFTIFLSETGYFTRSILERNFDLESMSAKELKELDQTCDFIAGTQEKIEYLQRLQEELRKLVANVKENKEEELTCFNVIQELKKCDKQNAALMSEKEQDDSEFLYALMNIFQLNPTRIVITRDVSNTKRTWESTSKKEESISILEIKLSADVEEPIQLVDFFQQIQISDYSKTSRREWPRGKDGSLFKYSREQTVIENSDLLIFHVSRQDFETEEKIETPILFPEVIKQRSTERRFTLQIVTIHTGSFQGGHYTAFFKRNGTWYYYDDVKPAEKRVQETTWDAVVKLGSVSGSLFFYSP